MPPFLPNPKQASDLPYPLSADPDRQMTDAQLIRHYERSLRRIALQTHHADVQVGGMEYGAQMAFNALLGVTV